MYSWILCCHIHIVVAHKCADLLTDLGKEKWVQIVQINYVIWNDLWDDDEKYVIQNILARSLKLPVNNAAKIKPMYVASIL